ncbi:cytochrome c [Flammeovirgaceae bacterium SG7u.111]|nr:cytochrome c [Flammeovirgaceae bacterium SG7u.132]WPO38590.1 cytochrome c [Flammeovirgaceae bacterium SG7u.111]
MNPKHYSFLSKAKLAFFIASISSLILLNSCSDDGPAGDDPTEELPSNLVYSVNQLELQKGLAGTSVEPTLKGNSPFTFKVSSEPDNGGAVTIDNEGVISVANTLAVGSYDLKITVSNTVGTAEFENAFSIVISDRAEVTFAANVKTIIENNCSSCHTTGSQPQFIDYQTAKNNVDNILDRIQREQGEGGFMPQGRSKLPQDDIDAIKLWKADGLKE